MIRSFEVIFKTRLARLSARPTARPTAEMEQKSYVFHPHTASLNATTREVISFWPGLYPNNLKDTVLYSYSIFYLSHDAILVSLNLIFTLRHA